MDQMDGPRPAPPRLQSRHHTVACDVLDSCLGMIRASMLGAAVIAIDGPSCAALELGARSMSAVCRSQSSVPLGASSAFWALVQQSSRALTGHG